MSLSRRDFIKAMSSTAVATGLVGCNSDDDRKYNQDKFKRSPY